VPATHRDAVAAAGATRPAQPGGPPWPAILLGSGAAAVLALVAAHRVGVASPRRRRPAAASPSAALGLVPAAAPPSPAPAELERESPPPPARPVPEPPPDPVAAAPRNVCQIRWHRDDDGSWFEAVVVGGRDRHTLASSPRFDWRGTVPPDRSPGAQAALRALVADLDETGWSPLRGRGREAGAPRWYARRFCRPVAADAVATAGGDSQSRRTGVR
jgi:hypothetical protein